MDIVNANISADLSVCAIEQGLLTLNPKDMDKVFLLISNNLGFNAIYEIFYQRYKNKKLINKFNFPLAHIDTSNVLSKDSWMLIDHDTKRIYYNEGV